MNKTRLNQILRILSLPYIESGLAKEDRFKETIKAYCAYIEDTKQFNPVRKTSAERNFVKMREAYVLFLAQKLEGSVQSLDDAFLISDKFFARSRVLDFMDRYHQNVEDMVDYLYIDNIFQIANSLLTTRDGIIAIRTWKNKPKPDFEEDIFGTGSAFHKVEIWNALTRILPTDIFIAAFVVINRADIRLLYRQHATISLADKLLAQVLEKGTAETHLNIVLPIGEHLENLLWLWGILGEDICHFTFNTLSLEKEILDCAKKIYQNMNGITVYALYEAYQKKFQYDLSDVFEECYPAENNKEPFSLCPYHMDMRKDGEKNWTVSELVCTFFCPVYVERYRQVIWLEISKEDIPWLSQVQSFVLEKVQRRGIYVETNPTSNLAIGAIEELYKHHMFRLNAPETSENPSMKRYIMATINSDDAAVFNTNVENEIAYVYHSLVEKGYPSEILLT